MNYSKIITNITIGNWYLVRGKPTKITPANVVWAFRDGCFPMPLTGEILEKYGFRREGGASYWHGEEHDACIIHWNKDRNELIVSDREVTPIIRLNVRFVHQLQDAMRQVGINKKIELT